MTQIYLIRHAEAEGNMYRLAHGHYNSRVTDFGERQIAALAKRFSDVHIDAVYASDLYRTQQTARAIADGKGLKINIFPMVREGGTGAWENMTWGDIEKNEPENLKNFNGDPENWHTAGCEPFTVVKSRMVKGILELAKAHDGQTIAVVSHGSAIRAFLSAVENIPSCDVNSIGFSDNTAVTLLNVEGNDIKVVYKYDNSHLKGGLTNYEKRPWWKDRYKSKSRNMRFVPLDPASDRDYYLECMRGIWLYTYNNISGFSESCFDEALKHLSADGSSVLISYLGRERTGLIEMDTLRGASRGAGYITAYYMREEYRGMCMAVQLLGQAVMKYRDMGRDRVVMEVPDVNENANRYFAHYGFRKVGEFSDKMGLFDIIEKDIRVL